MLFWSKSKIKISLRKSFFEFFHFRKNITQTRYFRIVVNIVIWTQGSRKARLKSARSLRCFKKNTSSTSSMSRQIFFSRLFERKFLFLFFFMQIKYLSSLVENTRREVMKLLVRLSFNVRCFPIRFQRLDFIRPRK